MSGTTSASGGSFGLDFSGLAPATDFAEFVTADAPDIAVPCFVAGARIATPEGDAAIETLRVGNVVLTASGEQKPTVWIGHSRVDCRRYPRPEEVIPVRVRAGAFAPGLPARDLVLSPGHAVFAEGVLVPIGRLVNGISIACEEHVAEVTYYHLELPEHGVVLAEGLPVESYLDDRNRAALAAGTPRRLLDSEGHARRTDKTCAPIRWSGPEVSALKQRLRARLEEWGYRPTTGGRVDVLAGGKRLLPRFARGGLQHVQLPPGVTELTIVSPRGVPAGFLDESGDVRWLGAQLSLVLLDGDWIPLDSPLLAAGFHGVEHDASGQWRWTKGGATLRLPPSNETRLLELFVRDVMQHWEAPADPLTQAA